MVISDQLTGCIQDYEDLVLQGFIFQKVQRVLLGLEVAHRGLHFQY
jgi:hypothetical protein